MDDDGDDDDDDCDGWYSNEEECEGVAIGSRSMDDVSEDIDEIDAPMWQPSSGAAGVEKNVTQAIEPLEIAAPQFKLKAAEPKPKPRGPASALDSLELKPQTHRARSRRSITTSKRRHLHAVEKEMAREEICIAVEQSCKQEVLYAQAALCERVCEPLRVESVCCAVEIDAVEHLPKIFASVTMDFDDVRLCAYCPRLHCRHKSRIFRGWCHLI